MKKQVKTPTSHIYEVEVSEEHCEIVFEYLDYAKEFNLNFSVDINVKSEAQEALKHREDEDSNKNRFRRFLFYNAIFRNKIWKTSFIAKQGIYFKDINGEKYLHGGVSPDEICIPFLRLEN